MYRRSLVVQGWHCHFLRTICRKADNLRVAMTRTLLGTCAFFFLLSQQLGADCGSGTLRAGMRSNSSDVVFSGTVLSAQNVRAGEVVILEVDQVWKGSVSKQFTIHNAMPKVNMAPSTRGISGFMRFVKGERYMVFAHRLTAEERALFGLGDALDSFGTGVCRDGSRPFKVEELSEIPPGRPPV